MLYTVFKFSAHSPGIMEARALSDSLEIKKLYLLKRGMDDSEVKLSAVWMTLK